LVIVATNARADFENVIESNPAWIMDFLAFLMPRLASAAYNVSKNYLVRAYHFSGISKQQQQVANLIFHERNNFGSEWAAQREGTSSLLRSQPKRS